MRGETVTRAARHNWLGALGACMLLALGAPAGAQWVELPGEGWAELAVSRQDTRERFDFDGARKPFFAEGHAITTSFHLTAVVGLFSGLDASVEIPFHRLDFTDEGGDLGRSALGDPRVFLRVSPPLFRDSDLQVALRGGVKLAGGDFPVSPEIIPLGEGQRDWEVIVEVGRSLGPGSMHVSGWLGYRWREANEERELDFGDEILFLAAVGGSFGRLEYKLGVDGIGGLTPELQGIRVESARRRLVRLLPSLFWRTGLGLVQVGTRLPFAGKNLPAGASFTLGYRMAWPSGGS